MSYEIERNRSTKREKVTIYRKNARSMAIDGRTGNTI